MSTASEPVTAERNKGMAFWHSAVAPSEDEDAFKKLIDDLRAEHKPHGVSEEENILQLAGLIWRRRNIGLFLDVENARRDYAAYTGESTLLLARAKMTRDKAKMLERKWEDHVKDVEGKKHQEEERAKLQTSPDGSRSPDGTGESTATGRPEDVEGPGCPTVSEVLMNGIRFFEMARQEVGSIIGFDKYDKLIADGMNQKSADKIELAYYAEFFTPEKFLERINLIEVIDLAIDRCLERLYRLKEQKRSDRERSSGRSCLLPPYGRRR